MSAPGAIIAGGAAVPFARYRDGSTWRDWVRRAGREAMAEAGVEPAQVDALVVASESDFFSLQLAPASVIADDLGLGRASLLRVEGGGASGALALRAACAQIGAGQARTVLVVGFEQTASHLPADDVRTLYALSFDADLEGMAGAGAACLYALSMALHMQRHGTTRRQMAHVAARHRCNAIGNPLAHRPGTVSVEEVLAAPVVSTPYTRLDCSPLSDGAAAMVLAHPGETRPGTPRSRVAGSGCARDRVRLGDRDAPWRFAAKVASAAAAYREAGLARPATEVRVAEIYDAFSGAAIQGLEALGLCPEGEGGAAVADGRFDPDGALPVNLSGGLLGQGAAPGATGIAQALAVHRRLWDPEGGDRRVGVADAHGGVCTLSVTHVLERFE